MRYIRSALFILAMHYGGTPSHLSDLTMFHIARGNYNRRRLGSDICFNSGNKKMTIIRLSKLPSFLAHNFAHVLNFCTHLSSGGTSSSEAKLSIFLDQSVSGHCDESHSGRTERMTNRKRAAPRVQFIHRQRPQLAMENTSVKWDSSNYENAFKAHHSFIVEVQSFQVDTLWNLILTASIIRILQSGKNTLPATDNSIIFFKITHVWEWYSKSYCHEYHILSVWNSSKY